MSTLSTQLCTPAEQKLSGEVNTSVHCLTRNESIALAFVAEAGVLSLLACLVTYVLILRNVYYYAQHTPRKWRLIKVPMDIYLLSLFAADILQSIGGVINAKWVHDGKTQTGSWCSAQAVTQTVGAMNVATNSLAIAVHTFVIVWCNKGLRANTVAYLVVATSWLYSILYLAAVGSLHHRGPNIFRPTPYWCWFGKDYLIHRLFTAYLWMWISLLSSLILYVPLYFWGRGNITVGDRNWNFKIHKRKNVEDPGGPRSHSLTMIAYPLVYAFLTLPMSVGRWLGFVQESHGDRINHVPPTATIAVQVIFSLSGIANVLLFLSTRPNLLLFGNTTEIGHRSMLSDIDSIEGDRDSKIVRIAEDSVITIGY